MEREDEIYMRGLRDGRSERPDVAPPPTDAAPVAWRWRIKTIAGDEDMWEFRRDKPKLSSAEYQVQPLYAHPEDAPGGPWEIGSTMDQDEFVVKSKIGFIGSLTWKQAIAVRDALNRLKGENDETD